MCRAATGTPMLSATTRSFSNAIRPGPPFLDPELLGIPCQPELARRRHIPDQRRRGDHDRTGEVALAAEAHAVLPVAVERRDRALPLFERVGPLAETGAAPRLPDLSADRAEHLR